MPATAPAGVFKLPGGPEKGKPLAECSTKSLEWWANSIGEKLDNNAAREGDEALHAALCAELARREQAPKGAA